MNQPITLFILNQQILQNIVNYLVERPFKEVAQLLEQIQSTAALSGDNAQKVLNIVDESKKQVSTAPPVSDSTTGKKSK